METDASDNHRPQQHCGWDWANNTESRTLSPLAQVGGDTRRRLHTPSSANSACVRCQAGASVNGLVMAPSHSAMRQARAKMRSLRPSLENKHADIKKMPPLKKVSTSMWMTTQRLSLSIVRDAVGHINKPLLSTAGNDGNDRVQAGITCQAPGSFPQRRIDAPTPKAMC